MDKPENSYLDLVTSEHRQKPKFMALIAALTEPLIGVNALLETMRRGFDLDTAVGVQLDQTGEWIGRSRHLLMPLTDVFFSWEIEGVGWGEGSWQGLYDKTSGLVSLPDDVYRLLLKAKVAANHWDGTRDGAYRVWEAAFADSGSIILIQDNQDMSILVGIAGTPPSALMEQLLVQGYIPLKPAGVRIKYYAVTPDTESGTLFAWDCDSKALAGWEKGAWPRLLSPADTYDFDVR